MANTKRTAMVGERIREHVATMLVRGEISDPRVQNVTIHSVKVTPDLQIAKVYFSVMGEPAQRQSALQGLRSAAGFVRNSLGKSLQIRFTPELQFYLDENLDHAMRISGILNKIAEERVQSDGDSSAAETSEEEKND